jgi:hypothetical protein
VRRDDRLRRRGVNRSPIPREDRQEPFHGDDERYTGIGKPCQACENP